MRVMRRALESACTPEQAPLRLDQLARRVGLPSRTALSGAWFGAHAIIAPSVEIASVDADTAFAVANQVP